MLFARKYRRRVLRLTAPCWRTSSCARNVGAAADDECLAGRTRALSGVVFGGEGCAALCTENGSLGEGGAGGPDAAGT